MVTTQERTHLDGGHSDGPEAGRPGAGAALLAFALFMLIALGSYTAWQKMGGEATASAHRGHDMIVVYPGKTVKDAAGKIEMAAFLGREVHVSHAKDFRHAEVVAMMGRSTLDLSDADLAAGGASIEAFALCGRVEIKVPPDWTVKTRDFVTLGALRNAAKAGAGATGADRRGAEGQDAGGSEKIVNLEGVVVLGAIEVVH